jgi:hypothetical protein
MDRKLKLGKTLTHFGHDEEEEEKRHSSFWQQWVLMSVMIQFVLVRVQQIEIRLRFSW